MEHHRGILIDKVHYFLKRFYLEELHQSFYIPPTEPNFEDFLLRKINIYDDKMDQTEVKASQLIFR